MASKSTGLPQVLGVQAAGAAPLVLGHPVDKPETVATAIRIGKPARGEQALQAAEESGGRIIAVSDDEILAMQRAAGRAGRHLGGTGLGGRAGRAGARDRRREHFEAKGKRIVAICTGHGLKDPDIITKEMTKPLVVPPRLDALEEAILGR